MHNVLIKSLVYTQYKDNNATLPITSTTTLKHNNTKTLPFNMLQQKYLTHKIYFIYRRTITPLSPFNQKAFRREYTFYKQLYNCQFCRRLIATESASCCSFFKTGNGHSNKMNVFLCFVRAERIICSIVLIFIRKECFKNELI